MVFAHISALPAMNESLGESTLLHIVYWDVIKNLHVVLHIPHFHVSTSVLFRQLCMANFLYMFWQVAIVHLLTKPNVHKWILFGFLVQ